MFLALVSCSPKHGNNNEDSTQNINMASNKNDDSAQNISMNKTDASPMQDIAMNKIDASSIIYKEKNGNTGVLNLAGNDGNFRFSFGINDVLIDYWKKTAEFDDKYQYYNNYYPEEYTSMEENIKNETNNFPGISFNTHLRKNSKNGIIFVDSFCFSAFESASIVLHRYLFLSTNNYNIRINIFLNDSKLEKEFIEESPKYFKIQTAGGGNLEYNNETKEKGWEVWDYKNDAIKMFGDDLLKGAHKSLIVNNWFNQTEEIIDGLGIK
jgi:hypothetical protein